MRSVLGVPIPGDAAPQGLLVVASRRSSAFNADDAAFLRLVAERVGLLLRHAEVEREVARTAARQEFLTVVSHELKTPVAVIKAYAEVLDRRGEMAAWPEQDRRIVERVQEQADRMLAMIQQLARPAPHRGRHAAARARAASTWRRWCAARARRSRPRPPRHKLRAEAPARAARARPTGGGSRRS